MLLSVVIPVFNNAAALDECLASFGQEPSFGGEVEYIVVDDGSEVPVKTDIQCVRVLHTSHCGAAHARNEGIAAAMGDFLWFVDADDRIDSSMMKDLLQVLRKLSGVADLFHTGPMVEVPSRDAIVHTHSCSVEDTKGIKRTRLFVPHTAYLDHTTYLVNRRLLEKFPDLRYPCRTILEDSLFVLYLIEKAKVVFVNETMHPYLHQAWRHSSTSGAWNEERCNRFVPDICAFFDDFRNYLVRHSEIELADECYCRMRYLYLRVLVVKGCTWPLLNDYRRKVYGQKDIAQEKGSLREILLSVPAVCRTLAFVCRKIRRKQ